MCHDTKIQISCFLLIFFRELKNAIRFLIRPLVSKINFSASQKWNDLKKIANSCSGWFFFFLLNTPVKLIHNGYINRIKEKSFRTGVGFLFLNHFNFDWMKLSSQQPEVGSKKRWRFWARGQILIKCKISWFMYHDNHDDHDDHDHHDDHHDTKIQISCFLLTFFCESKNAIRFLIKPLVAEIASESSICLESSNPAYI